MSFLSFLRKISNKEKEIFIKVMKTMDKNLDDILKGGN